MIQDVILFHWQRGDGVLNVTQPFKTLVSFSSIFQKGLSEKHKNEEVACHLPVTVSCFRHVRPNQLLQLTLDHKAPCTKTAL